MGGSYLCVGWRVSACTDRIIGKSPRGRRRYVVHVSEFPRTPLAGRAHTSRHLDDSAPWVPCACVLGYCLRALQYAYRQLQRNKRVSDLDVSFESIIKRASSCSPLSSKHHPQRHNLPSLHPTHHQVMPLGMRGDC